MSLAVELRPLKCLIVDRLRMLLSAWERNGLPRHPPPDQMSSAMSSQEQALFRLLIAPRPVPATDVVAALGDTCVAALVRLGVIQKIGEQLESVGLRLRSMNGLCVLAGNAGPGYYVHFGDDSRALMDAALSVRPASLGLELCCGSALASIALARTHDHVTACELQEGVAAVARVNAVLADAENLDVHCGDLWTPVLGRRFDTILANPPFAPSLGDRVVDPVADGGADGLCLARAIWSSAEAFLSPNGMLLLLTGMLGDGTTMLAQSELLALAHRNNWLVEIIEVNEPHPVEHVIVPELQIEPTGIRMQALQTQARALGASHYQIVLLRMGPHERSNLVRCRTYLPAGDRLKLQMKASRSRRALGTTVTSF